MNSQKLLFTLYVLFTSLATLSGQPIGIVKAEMNSDSYVTVYLKAGKNPLDTSKLQFFENDKQISYIRDTAAIAEFTFLTDILFVLNSDANSDSLKVKMILDCVQKSEINSRINFAFFQNEEETMRKPRFASPEFSKNFAFFDTYTQEVSPKPKNVTITFCSFLNLLYETSSAAESAQNKRAFVFVTDSIPVSNFQKTCFDELGKFDIPLYFVFTDSVSRKAEEKLITLSSGSGGLYTNATPETIEEIIVSYIKDIDLHTITDNEQLSVLRFKSSQKNFRNTFTVVYGTDTIQSYFLSSEKVGDASYGSAPYLILIFILTTLLIITLFVKSKRKRKISDTKTITEEKFSPKIIKAAGSRVYAELYVISKENSKKYILTAHSTTIGRAGENSISVSDTTMSAFHAKIWLEDGDYFLEDLDSTNGTMLNGKRVQKSKLADKDFIQMGTSSARFSHKL